MDLLNKLEMARHELLDMGLRGNALLHIPKNKRYLDVVEERSEDIYRILVDDKASMSFLPVPDVYDEESEEQGGLTDHLSGEGGEAVSLPALKAYLDANVGSDRFGDKYLQTRLGAGELDARLLKIESEAHTLLQEQGIEVLYVALGMLEWYEDPNASTPRYAPLVLVPVELTRDGAGSQFALAYTSADMGPNLTLAAKLKGEFRLDLPGFDDEFDIGAYFDAAEASVSSQPRWEVHRNHVVLGLFSFGKFQMYMDLDPNRWPEDIPLKNNEQLKRIFGSGFHKDSVFVDSAKESPYLCAPEEMHLVKDADSSQMEAIVSVMNGANLVIQGPPGTGKSQTITNVIAEAVARGKKVLFVAQKMAALEVVKARLDECHLGDAVLELHSHKTNKKAVLESLKKVFELGAPKVPDRKQDYERLAEIKQRLNVYIEDVSKPILKSGINYIDALGHMLALQRDDALRSIPRISFRMLSGWSAADFERGKRALESIEDHLLEYGAPVVNPYFGSRKATFSPTEDQDLSRLIARTRELLEKLADLAERLSSEMTIPMAASFVDISTLHRAGQRALDAPHLKGVKVSTEEWQARSAEVKAALSSGARMSEIRLRLDAIVIDAAFGADVLPIRLGLAGRADKWWRIFSSEYRKAKATLRGFMKTDLVGKPLGWLSWVDDILIYQEQEKIFREAENICETLFGAQWQGLKSDWQVLEGISGWIIDLYRSIGAGDIPSGITNFLEGDPDLKAKAADLKELEQLSDLTQSGLKELQSFLDLDPDRKALPHSLLTWKDCLEGWSETSKLYHITNFNQLEADLTNVGLQSQVMELRDWRHSPKQLVNWLELSYYTGLVNHAYADKLSIGRFDRLTHERFIRDFQKLDSATLNHAQEALVEKLYASLPAKQAPGEMEVLRREFAKKRRHIPLRRLMTEAGNVIQQAKPVFMMSPMSVATYLPQGRFSFDLVVFDEASQIPAPEALGAIARGAQAVVVGDSKQMPPTNFFAKSVEMTDEEASESTTADIESILGLMEASGAPDSMLRWHYRSRHDSLIAVSNDQFYDNRLLIFPSPGVNPHARGLRFRHVPDGIYDRGVSRANLVEARAVAEAVMEHARATPHLTLGVVAFSSAQREVIMLEVERLRRESPETEDYFRHHTAGDEFFIKNLENVQGDERDVIFISVGYGKTAAGKLSQNFGPLNTKGGERRLNVLISRSRLAMDVFANFTADELRTEAGSPFGVRALKAFLLYAETGELEKLEETGREADSPFEVEVHRAIQEMGYEVEPQVGSQGFYIDLAVRCPQKPGRYILAVECDGASYHSSAVARDRDRLRQSVLEGLGWRFHRIWSTEWFRNPSAEVVRLRQAIENAISEQDRLDTEKDSATPKAVVTEKGPAIMREDLGEEESSVPHYIRTEPASLGVPKADDFHAIPEPFLSNAIKTILSNEGPVHFQLIASRLIEAAGVNRAGNKIQSRISQLLDRLKLTGGVEGRGDFYWLVKAGNKGMLSVRSWECLPAPERKLDYVSDMELANAIFLMVRDAHSVSLDDCLSAALDLIGFKRLTKATRERLASICQTMIQKGWLKEHADRLQLGEASVGFDALLLGLSSR